MNTSNSNSVNTGAVAALAVPAFSFGAVNYMEDEAAAFQRAGAELNTILASPEFQEEVLAMDAKYTLGLSNQEIYEMMVERSPLKVALNVFDGNHCQNYEDLTEGYEESEQPGVCHVNRFFLVGNGYNTGFIGSLMLHETMHVLGFKHDEEFKLSSVPYVMNAIYSRVAGRLGLSAPDSVHWDQAKADAWFNARRARTVSASSWNNL